MRRRLSLTCRSARCYTEKYENSPQKSSMDLDEQIFLYVSHALQIPWVRMLSRLASALAAGDQLASFCVLLIIAAYLSQRPRLARIACGGALALIASGIVVQLLKRLIGRARPRMGLGDLYFIGPNFFQRGFDSFPSGHAIAVFALIAFVCSYYPKLRIPLYGLAFLVAVLGRVVSGQHFLSDVMAGAILGAGIGIFLARRFHGFIERPDASRAAAAAPPISLPANNRALDHDSQAGAKGRVIKEIFLLVAFSSLILFIGLGDAGPGNRAVSALFGLLSSLATYFLARELWGGRTGIYAGLILSSSLLFVNVSRLLLADSSLLFFSVLAVLFYIHSGKRSRRADPLLALCYISVGLGFLSKGTVALFPVVVFLLYEYLSEKPSWAGFIRRNFFRHALFLAFTLLVSTPWLGYGLSTQEEAVASFPLLENLPRALRGFERGTGQLIYYLPISILGLFPWTFFMIAYFVQEGKRWIRETAVEPRALFLFLWATVVLTVFSFSTVKFPHAMVLALPPLCCLLGRFIKAEIPQARGFLRFCLLATLLFAAGLSLAAVAVYFLRPQYAANFIVPLAILTCSLLVAWLHKDRSRREVVFATICIGGLAFYVSSAVIQFR